MPLPLWLQSSATFRKDQNMATAKHIEANRLYLVEQPNAMENLCLMLAEAIHRSRSKRSVISWEAQVEAAAYVNEHGMDAALDRLVALSD
jgi:hypothetical protein